MQLWQPDFIEKLKSLVQHEEDVVALVLFGSSCQPERLDAWSDVDCLLVVDDETLYRYFPSTEWLSLFGKIVAYEQHEGEFAATTRICFQNMRRADFLIVTISQLKEIDQLSHLLWQGCKILFSRSRAVEEAFSHAFAPPVFEAPSPDLFEKMVNDFWFKAAIAIQKAMREDLLIAAHLTLDLSRDCYVIAMMIRDRKEQTTVHRTGGIGNEMVMHIEVLNLPFTKKSVVKSVQKLGKQFDSLAQEWSAAYKPRCQNLDVNMG